MIFHCNKNAILNTILCIFFSFFFFLFLFFGVKPFYWGALGEGRKAGRIMRSDVLLPAGTSPASQSLKAIFLFLWRVETQRCISRSAVYTVFHILLDCCSIIAPILNPLSYWVWVSVLPWLQVNWAQFFHMCLLANDVSLVLFLFTHFLSFFLGYLIDFFRILKIIQVLIIPGITHL